MNKKALVLTYHVKNCKREGGFHKFISYLKEMSFDIDWVTCTMSFSWVLHKNDRENIKNFLDLWKGIEFQEGSVYIRHFAVPVWLPAKMARYLNKELCDHYWASWKKIRKRLQGQYDVILVEGTGAQYAVDLRKEYPTAKIIYRPSDILESYFKIPDAVEIEKKMIEIADITYCVDENQRNYYTNHSSYHNKLQILRNPVASEQDILELRNYVPEETKRKSVVYLGVSGVDLELIESTAKHYQDVTFVVIGPFDKKSHDNVVYTGALKKDEYHVYLKEAAVGIQPMRKSLKGLVKFGYTKKIILYMKYLLPIVATGSDNYLNTEGFFTAENADEFITLVGKALSYSLNERIELREGYLEVLEEFVDLKCKEQFKNGILKGVN